LSFGNPLCYLVKRVRGYQVEREQPEMARLLREVQVNNHPKLSSRLDGLDTPVAKAI